ncbi:amino acid permease [Actinomadura parmotrematis]|uniref:Amino acid permease n=1 Tax=Actinomadura parmotrematis TaxID=2864039 RepID=A0ABS7FM04_9ACTN|nr:amino acid permease [Actinomadura parmotrematis]MBW8481035.1 amino acid permease [Actinomadura parmotrematis]
MDEAERPERRAARDAARDAAGVARAEALAALDAARASRAGLGGAPDSGAGEDEGYRQSLKPRHIQMIAMGGAIGVGLFLGTSQRLAQTGPGLVLAYLAAGVAALFVMRALGELVLYKPTAGSFVTYARDFVGEWAGFASGWMYWLNWAMTGVAEITAIGIYVHYWAPGFPQWLSALLALAVLLTVNLVSVRLFGELEFWFALVKVVAIVAFLVVGIVLVTTHAEVGGHRAEFANLVDYGGFFPQGWWAVLLSLQGVIFAYAAIEMVGISAGEAENPREVLPGAINGVVWRIALFYVGAVFLLVVVLPWTVYTPDESPFVTVFAALGVPAVGGVMNLVVLTAALSSTNSGLYSTGRILRSLSQRREAPAFVGRMSSHHVPYGGILFTSVVYVAGVVLNVFVPHKAFEIATSIASLGVLTTWATLLYAQVRFRRAAERGEVERPSYRMPGSPYTNYATLAFLVLVVVLMGFDADQRWAVYAVPVLAAALWGGWRYVRPRRTAAPRRPQDPPR